MSSSGRFARVRALFEEALDLPAERRAALLDERCAGDRELRDSVEAMLAAESASAGFLEAGSGPVGPPMEHIGGYRIVRELGSGGMGVVYEALQENPRRSVALKVLRLALGSPGYRRRFQDEAVLLARLDHPAIARVIEAGVDVARAGQEVPYLVMEFVPGARDLLSWSAGRPVGERLELFAEVCEAVHHGHQQGVLHRDIKPQNVLVDGSGRPKVIDFGVARAIDEDDEERTRATRTGELVGTLTRMSPEQLEEGGARVDTRTDVYALGLLLYELLWGCLPYELDGTSITAIARTIRETPPRDPRQLGTHLPEDLAWVALRALEKEPDRRYPSASELAADVRRFLRHEPVVAGPPSRVYLLRKFVRRHRFGVGAAALLALAVLGGAVAAGVGFLRARDEATKFRTMNRVLEDILASVQVEVGGRDVRVADLLDRADQDLGTALGGRPEIEGPLRQALASSYSALGLHEEAEANARAALELATGPEPRGEAAALLAHSLLRLGRRGEAAELVAQALPGTRAHGLDAATSRLRAVQGRLFLAEGRTDAALEELRSALAEATEHLGPDSGPVVELEGALQDALLDAELAPEALELAQRRVERMAGRPDDAETLSARLAVPAILTRAAEYTRAAMLLEELLPRAIQVLGERHPQVLSALGDLSRGYKELGRLRLAVELAEAAAQGWEQRVGPDHPSSLAARTRVAEARVGLGDTSSVAELEAILETTRRLYGERHADTIQSRQNLGLHLLGTRDLSRAQMELEHALAGWEDLHGRHHVDVYQAAHALGLLLAMRERPEEALPHVQRAWNGLRGLLGPDHEDTIRAASNTMVVLARLGDHQAALPIALEVYQVQQRRMEPSNPNLTTLTTNLARLYQELGDTASARRYYVQALERARQHLPEDNRAGIFTRIYLAELLLASGAVDEDTLELTREGLEATELHLSRNREDLCRAQLVHGHCLRALGRPEEALLFLEVAYETLDGERHPDQEYIVRTVEQLVECLTDLGRPEEAAVWRARLPGSG